MSKVRDSLVSHSTAPAYRHCSINHTPFDVIFLAEGADQDASSFFSSRCLNHSEFPLTKKCLYQKVGFQYKKQNKTPRIKSHKAYKNNHHRSLQNLSFIGQKKAFVVTCIAQSGWWDASVMCAHTTSNPELPVLLTEGGFAAGISSPEGKDSLWSGEFFPKLTLLSQSLLIFNDQDG